VLLYGEVLNTYLFYSETLMGRDHLKNPATDEGILLKWILQKYGGGLCA
jgi:hypothetical protein